MKCGRYGKFNPHDPLCRDVCAMMTSCKVRTERTCPKCGAEMVLRAGVTYVCPTCGETKPVKQ